jgi:branched-chain amino acid transport system substrate-binding protein
VSGAIAAKVVKDPAKYTNFWKGDYNSDAYARCVFKTIEFLVSSSQWTPSTRTVAFVVEDTDYGRSNAADAGKLFENDGWKTATVETVPLGHTDFYPQLNKVKTLAPDLVVTVFTGLASGVAFVKQYQEVGVKGLHMAVYYPTRPEFIAQAGQAAEGLIWTALMFHPGVLKHQAAMAAAVQKKFNVKATSDHAYGYDGVFYVADALKRASTMNGAKVNEALSRSEFRGLLGRYVFDPQDHHAKDGAEFLPVPAAQIQGGQNVIIWPENVASAKYQIQPWIR